MRRLAAVMMMLLLLAGCRGKEPDELALVRVLGVDGKDPVTLTAVCGGNNQGDESRGISAGADFLSALNGLPWADTETEEELSLTSVSYLVVSRDVDLEAILLEVLKNQELAGMSTLWLADEGAAELLDRCADPAAGLALLTRQGAGAPTAVGALASLYNDGQVALPLLTASGGGLELRGVETWRAA